MQPFAQSTRLKWIVQSRRKKLTGKTFNFTKQEQNPYKTMSPKQKIEKWKQLNAAIALLKWACSNSSSNRLSEVGHGRKRLERNTCMDVLSQTVNAGPSPANPDSRPLYDRSASASEQTVNGRVQALPTTQYTYTIWTIIFYRPLSPSGPCPQFFCRHPSSAIWKEFGQCSSAPCIWFVIFHTTTVRDGPKTHVFRVVSRFSMSAEVARLKNYACVGSSRFHEGVSPSRLAFRQRHPRRPGIWWRGALGSEHIDEQLKKRMET